MVLLSWLSGRGKTRFFYECGKVQWNASNGLAPIRNHKETEINFAAGTLAIATKGREVLVYFR